MSGKPSIIERLLAGIDLMDAAQACALLRVETDDPGAAMKSMIRDGAVIDIAYNGQANFPRFQFDTGNARIFGVVTAILKVRPAHISNLRLAYWMTRPHTDFGRAPADVFGQEDAAVLAAFGRCIEPNWHG